ncbi:MAG: hypothetical protein ACLT1W_10320 [Alistipes onderdonkii]
MKPGISRSHPAAFIILIDQSGSMQEPTLFLNRKMAKSEAGADGKHAGLELLSRSKREDGYAIISTSPYWGITANRYNRCGAIPPKYS